MNELIIFGDKNKLSDVYRLEYLNKFDELNKLDFFNLNDVKENSFNFISTNYIFTTWGFPKMCKQDIKKYFPNLKAIFYAAGTTEYFRKDFEELGIQVFNAVKANSESVIQFVLGIILLANKGYFEAVKKYKIPIFKYNYILGKEVAKKYGGNYHKKIGILALGNVGKGLAGLLKHFDFEVYAYDPYVDDQLFDSLGIKKVSLEYIFENCDVISNHLPNTEETKNIINYKLLKKLKKYSVFINTGRGLQINEKDLFKILRKNKNIYAFLDVTAKEPLFPFSKWHFLPNVYLSPHIAGSVGNEYERMVLEVIQQYRSFVK